MRILGMESSSMVASAAIVEDGITMAEYTANFKKTHSQTLLPMIDAMVSLLGIELSSLDAIAVSGGPGSFTGLRIGSTTAKGLGLALKKPLIHVPTLDAMAFQIFGTSGLICAMLDARKGNVFAGIYRNTERFEVIKENCHINISGLAEELNQLGEPVILTGDGADAYMEQMQEICQVPLHRAPAFANRARAGSVAALGAVYYQEGRIQTAVEHVPDYLRVSQAERQLEQMK